MAWSLFKARGTVSGAVVINDLPPNETYSVSVSLCSAATSVPLRGKPPGHAHRAPESQRRTNFICELPIKEADAPNDTPLEFETIVDAGLYDATVVLTVHSKQDGTTTKQSEHVWPLDQKIEVKKRERTNLTLEVTWPGTSYEELMKSLAP